MVHRRLGRHRPTSRQAVFFTEPLPGGRTGLVSRFRSGHPPGPAHRLSPVPYVTEAVGFVMDREMLRGIANRVVRQRRKAIRTAAPAG